MAALTGKKPKNTYKDLLQVSNSNAGIDGTLRFVSDGEGTDSTLKLSTSSISTTSKVVVGGDTAAGDDAAIGFTAAEGLILTGQGSTNDVTIKNDADGDVVAIPTGGTDVNFHGNINVLAQGDLRLQDSSGGQYAAIQAPSTVGSSYTLTLPDTDGNADEVLTTNGSGVLSWAAASAGLSAAKTFFFGQL